MIQITRKGSQLADATTAMSRVAPGTQRTIASRAAVAALGIVYGDLGTSPLYTLQTVVADAGGRPDAKTALGILSLIVWALLVTISVKYCLFVMRADNHGEGGILALLSLIGRQTGRWAAALTVMGLFGAALIYGDGIITPAISVLQRSRRRQRGHERTEALCDALCCRHSVGVVRCSDLWHSTNRSRLRACDDFMVLGNRINWACGRA